VKVIRWPLLGTLAREPVTGTVRER